MNKIFIRAGILSILCAALFLVINNKGVKADSCEDNLASALYNCRNSTGSNGGSCRWSAYDSWGYCRFNSGGGGGNQHENPEYIPPDCNDAQVKLGECIDTYWDSFEPGHESEVYDFCRGYVSNTYNLSACF